MMDAGMNISDIAKAIGAEVFGPVQCAVRAIVTDSRSVMPDTDAMFFALRTRQNDGHRYVTEMYGRGIRAFVVDRLPEGHDVMDDAAFLVVPDTAEALRLLGNALRSWMRMPVVAIAGSRGKTGLKEWLFQLLEPDHTVTRSPRSYNSQIGVPLALWEMDSQADIALVETGVSRSGEMTRLEEIVKPDTVIFTTLTHEHSGGFSSMEQKAAEKALIARHTKLMIAPADSQPLRSAIEKAAPDAQKIWWSIDNQTSDSNLKVSTHQTDDSTILTYIFGEVDGCLTIPFTARHDVENAVSALALMLDLGIDSQTIAERMGKLTPVGTRLDVRDGVNDCSIIYDSYTCDFDSLHTALDFMARQAAPEVERTLIISQLHHGSFAEPETAHKLIRLCKAAGISRLICIGFTLDAELASKIARTEHYADTEEFMVKRSTSDFSHEIILVKGAPAFGLQRVVENLEARTHETVLEVNLDSVVKNYNHFRRRLPADTGIIAMVKASGYGAGSLEIAKTLQAQGAAYLAVAVIDEGVELRNAGITMPIMVMNPKVVNYRSMFANRLEPEIYSLAMLRDVVREADKNGVTAYPIHIKLDTGMHRMGFEPDELDELVSLLRSTDAVTVSSVFSHLATADIPDMEDYTQHQLALFDSMTERLQRELSTPFRRHILNSAGILRHPERHYDMVRLGIGLYGVNPIEGGEKLHTVSTLRTVIIQIKERHEGDSIGYSRRGRVERTSRIATIPIGYADGMNRRFGCGRSRVFVNGKEAPTIGNICMDACMIDVTGIDCAVGDHVEIFGPHIPVERLAKTLDTIPYEVLTSVSPRVKRVYYRE